MKFYGKEYSILCETLFQKLDNKLKLKLIVVQDFVQDSLLKPIRYIGNKIHITVWENKGNYTNYFFKKLKDKIKYYSDI